VACGKAFTMRRPSGKANRGLVNEGQFCSVECAGAAKRWPSRLARKQSIKRMLKKALFDREDVANRDGWMCRICGEAVDQTIAYPDKRSGCSGHDVAPSKGGKHDWSNVHLAHLGCAVDRRARDLAAVAKDAAAQVNM